MKYILVTGAFGGMGRKTVENLARQGFGVIALDKNTYDIDAPVIPIRSDITDPESVKTAFEKVKTITEELYAIVHFAGIYIMDSLIEVDNDRFENSIKVNVLGAFLVNKIFFPLLKKGSKIVITTSELAPLSPLPFTGIYAITKSMLDKYAFSLRMELQMLGISVSVIRAGAVETGMLGTSTAELDKFCVGTKLYSVSVSRFKKIVSGFETKRISPEKIAQKVSKILGSKRPKFAYGINRDPLLFLFNILPKKLQFFIIKQVLSI